MSGPKGFLPSRIDLATLPDNEILIKAKYRVTGRAKKSKVTTGGNSGTGGAKKILPVGIPRHYRGKTKYR